MDGRGEPRNKAEKPSRQLYLEGPLKLKNLIRLNRLSSNWQNKMWNEESEHETNTTPELDKNNLYVIH
jgi:hypothetical protein